MNARRRSFLLAAVFFMASFAPGIAFASISTPWIPTDGDVNNIKITGSLDLYIYDSGDTSKYLKVLPNPKDTSFATIYFTEKDTGWYAGLSTGATDLYLGESPRFGWFFDDPGISGVDHQGYTYSTNLEGKIYTLTSSDGSTTVYEIDAVPVPLPGSAVLLGSGVLCLLGMGVRHRVF